MSCPKLWIGSKSLKNLKISLRFTSLGVASKFKAVKDNGGEGIDGTGGGASGLFGERRIIWTMVQAINNVHRFFLKTTLISPDAALDLTRRVVLTHERRMLMEKHGIQGSLVGYALLVSTKKIFESLLRQLHRAIKPYMPKTDGTPSQICDPGFAKAIHISTFGFFRGATQARVFNNWMLSLCALDAFLTGSKHQHTLGGIPVVFDFLGVSTLSLQLVWGIHSVTCLA